MKGDVLNTWIAAVAGATVVVASAASAVAATAPQDPKTLVLRKADLPAGAVPGPNYDASPSTFGASERSVTFNVRVGSREEVVVSDVAVSRNTTGAATGYKRLLATYTGLPGESRLRLPAYGDEQRAVFSPGPARGTLIVRRKAVVWRLTVEDCGPLSPAGCLGGRTPPRLTRAQALSELGKYARKQKARIGNG